MRRNPEIWEKVNPTLIPNNFDKSNVKFVFEENTDFR